MGRNFKNNNTAAPIPGRIRSARMARGLTITELAQKLEVTKQALSQYELGHSSPSGEIFMRLVNILGFPTGYFFKPLNTDVPNGTVFYRSLKSTAQKSREIQSSRLDMLEDIFKHIEEYIDFPDVNLPNVDELVSGDLDGDDIEEIASRLRRHWGLGNGPISNVTTLLENNGIIISKMKFDDLNVDAYSQWRGNRPYVFVGADKEAAGRLRFNLMHEVGHLIMHKWVTPIDLKEKLKQIEGEAHRLSSAFLLPRETFAREVMSTSLNHFIELKKRWNVSIQAMIKRCEDLEILNDNQVLYLRKQISAKRMNKKEPLDDVTPIEEPKLLRQAIVMLVEHGGIERSSIIEDLCLPQGDVEPITGVEQGFFSPIGKVVSLNFKKTSQTS
ncbi:helix-turn-helix domain-containing protein [Paenibacillus glucanolyticus]|uniref:helix-turn-helix domain-containing protein n=1 Tax=Paenibacillus glucanolyticus TaxID=59843 RepID=UPI00128E4DB2|nr:XRE family transcriptional regulator [Paenibacillus glucanolyticus]MPY20057.1 ImmA/IrrE family metallo-endopeptidase [Paenibacillus glucanolyticus]